VRPIAESGESAESHEVSVWVNISPCMASVSVLASESL
jgi:hypothetical protein